MRYICNVGYSSFIPLYYYIWRIGQQLFSSKKGKIEGNNRKYWLTIFH